VLLTSILYGIVDILDELFSYGSLLHNSVLRWLHRVIIYGVARSSVRF